ncbi:unnamed protein product [Toxocara canis]|uniref:G protein-coupled receptor n=1 Tax=Toxocara canis TaxID=6265 RepID=A0A183V413_TOXCA|nr:unnamed protein product [Toxocara canis]
MSVLGTVLTINTHFTSALSVLPNLLVIYLALTTGINEIPEYRFIIIVQAFNEILNSVTLSIIDMGNTQSPDGYTIIEMGTLAKTNEFAGVAIQTFYSFLYIFNLFLVPILFIYRYAVICSSHRLRQLFRPAGVVVLAAISLPISAYTAVSSTAVSSASRNKTIDSLFGSNNILVIRVPNSIYATDAMSLPGVDYKMFTSAISAIVLAVLVFGGYTIVFITSKRIFATLNGVRIVEKTRRLQKQLAIIMLLQAILPLIFIILPLAILFSLIYAQVTIGPYASFASIAFNWQPCAQPYITLYFLSPFRKRIRKMLPFGWTSQLCDLDTNPFSSIVLGQNETVDVFRVKRA